MEKRKCLRRGLIILICVALISGILPASAFADDSSNEIITWDSLAAACYSGGVGTLEEPYQISSGEELALLAKSVNEGNSYDKTFFVLTKDIDLADAYWTPIGNSSNVFNGYFDGEEHVINNLCAVSSQDNLGLFGVTGIAAIISNIIVRNAEISGNKNVGAIVGKNEGTVANCQTQLSEISGKTHVGGIIGSTTLGIKSCITYKSSIKGNGNRIGGITGYAGFIDSKHSYTIGECGIDKSEVIGADAVGGIIGYQDNGDSAYYSFVLKVEKCFNLDTSVTGKNNVGGIIGTERNYFTADKKSVNECFNTGVITGDNYVGGIIGRVSCVFNDGKASITDSYNTGSIYALVDNAGGICGATSKNITNCYDIGNAYEGNGKGYSICAATGLTSLGDTYWATIVGCYYLNGYDPNGTRLAQAQFANKESFDGWDFENVWTLNEGTYPKLRSVHTDNNHLPPIDFFFKEEEYTGNIGQTICLLADVNDSNGNNENILEEMRWSVDKPDVASILKINKLVVNENCTRIELFLMLNSCGTARVQGKMIDGTRAACNVQVNDKIDEKFNRNIFQANLLVGDSRYGSDIKNTLSEEIVTQKLIEELKKDGFEDSVALSEAIDIIFKTANDITELADFAFRPKDLYSAIILNLLECSIDADAFEKFGEISAVTNDLFSLLRDSMLTKYKIEFTENYDMSLLNEEQKGYANELIKDYLLRMKFVEMGQINDFFSFISDFNEGIGTVDSFLKEICSCAMLTQLNSQTKKIVATLYERCPNNNLALKSALKECKDLVETSTDDINKMIVERTIAVAGKTSLKYIVSKKWEAIRDKAMVSHPSLAIIMLGYKSGTFASNNLFNTDKIKGKYFEMLAVNDIEMLTDAVFSGIKGEYISSQNEEKAKILLEAIDMIYRLRIIDCDNANNFAAEIDDAFVSKMMELWGQSSTANAKEYIEIRKRKYQSSHLTEQKGWINYLPYELFQKYNEYYNELAEQKIKKSFVVACPVDLLIYDENDVLVGKVIDNVPWVEDDASIGIGVTEDIKTIYFLDDGERYKIKYVGNDTGKMDLSIKEYEEGTEEVKRSVFFYNIPLTDSEKYTQYNDNDVINNEYALLQHNSNQTINPQMDSLEDEKTYTAKVQSGVIVKDNQSNFEVKARCNERITLMAYVPEGYYFAGWQSSCGKEIFINPDQITTEFIMPDDDVLITAIVKKKQQSSSDTSVTVLGKQIEAFDGIGGTISPSGKLSIPYGQSQTFTITPDDGYEIEDVLVDGKSVGAVSSYTFEKVTADHTISANFKKTGDITPGEDDKTITERINAAKDVKIKVKTSLKTNGKGKKYIKVQWTKEGAAVTGYQIYRSYKKNGSYKKFFTTKNKYYNNTKSLKKGKRHYFKVRAYTVIEGKKYYSKWSNLAYRTVK